VFLLHRVNDGFKIKTADAQFPMIEKKKAEIIAGLRAR
jgi:hypothetical protein